MLLETISPLVGAVDSEAHITSHAHKTEKNQLQEEPTPAASFLLPALTSILVPTEVLLTLCLATWAIKIPRLHLDDVEVVGELTSLGGETEIGDSWKLDARNLEAIGPLILLLVHEVDGQRLILEVCDPRLGWKVGVAKAASLYDC